MGSDPAVGLGQDAVHGLQARVLVPNEWLKKRRLRQFSAARRATAL